MSRRANIDALASSSTLTDNGTASPMSLASSSRLPSPPPHNTTMKHSSTTSSPSSTSSITMATPSTSRHTLTSMPPEILEHIAYYAAFATVPRSHCHTSTHDRPDPSSTTPALQRAQEAADAQSPTPPAALAALLATDKRAQHVLNFHSNPRLYARIFRAKFDTAAIARRYGKSAISTAVLAAELRRRCIILKRIKRAGQVGWLRPEGNNAIGAQNLRENLWLAYLMLTENDGSNVAALTWANISQYLALHHSQEMVESAIQPGYPPDSEDRALALHIAHLITDPKELGLESKDETEERLFVLRPFVFASHKFESFFAPWPLRHLPIPPISSATTVRQQSDVTEQGLFNRSASADAQAQFAAPPGNVPPGPPPIQRSTNPFLADLAPRSREVAVEHCGKTLRMRPPILSHAAFLSFFMQVEKDPAIVGLQAITQRGQEPGTQHQHQHQNGDNRRAPVQLGLLDPVLGGGTNGTAIDLPAVTRTAATIRSLDHDRDLTRLLSCYDPFDSPGLRPCFFAGVFEGPWEGRFSFFDFDSYREMLAGRMRSLYEGPFGEQPQVWRMKEHFVKVGPGSDRKRGGTGAVISAGYPVDEAFEETTRLPRTLQEAKDRDREKGDGKRSAAGGSVGEEATKRNVVTAFGSNLASGSQTPTVDEVNGPSEESPDGVADGKGKSRTVAVDRAHPSADFQEKLHASSRPEDYALYPSFSEEDGGARAGHGRIAGLSDEDDSNYEMLVSGMGHSAWGRFVLRGRVRAWDGMIIMSKEYRPDGRGRWLYRGYVVGGKTLIGRWRDSFTPADMSGYEGPFLLKRRQREGDVPAPDAPCAAAGTAGSNGATTA